MLPTCIPVDSTPSHSITLPYHTIPYIALHTLRNPTSIIFHTQTNTTCAAYIKLHDATLQYISLHQTKLHYTTLHYTLHSLHYILSTHLHTYVPTYEYLHTHNKIFENINYLHTTRCILQIHCITLHHITLYTYIPVHRITVQRTTLHSGRVLRTTLHHSALNHCLGKLYI